MSPKRATAAGVGRVPATPRRRPRAALVDYEEVSRLRRQVLAPMAASLLAGTVVAPRRALPLRRGASRTAGLRPLPGRPRRPQRPAAVRIAPSTVGYHLYAQWAAAQQLAGAAASTPLYADLPVGVHPEGLRSAVGAARLRHRGARRRSAGSLLRGRAGLVVSAAPSRADAGGRVPLFHRDRAARLCATPPTCGSITSWDCSASTGSPKDSTPATARTCRTGPTSSTPWSRSKRTGRAASSWARTSAPCPAGVRERMAERSHAALLGPPVRVERGRPVAHAARFGPGLVGYPRPGPLRGLFLGHRHRRERARRAPVHDRGDDGARGARDAGAPPCSAAVERTRATSPATPAAPGTRQPSSCALAWPIWPRSPADLVMVDLEELWGERQPQNRPGTGPEASNWRRGRRTPSRRPERTSGPSSSSGELHDAPPGPTPTDRTRRSSP